MGAFESLSGHLEFETWTFPRLGRVVVVATIDGGDPFVFSHEDPTDD